LQSIKAMTALKLEATRQHCKAHDFKQDACKHCTAGAITGRSSWICALKELDMSG
jgi:hypothetical protein